MGWVELFIMILSFILTKNKTGSTTKAAAAAAISGAGAYYVSHNTDWGKATIGNLNDSINEFIGLKNADGSTVKDADGEEVKVPAGTTVLRDAAGNVVLAPNGQPTILGAAADVLKSWGGTGTAAVIGTTALATSGTGSDFIKKYGMWIAVGAAAFLLFK